MPKVVGAMGSWQQSKSARICVGFCKGDGNRCIRAAVVAALVIGHQPALVEVRQSENHQTILLQSSEYSDAICLTAHLTCKAMVSINVA
ncbi:hypothetical protein CBM2592_A230080 [Cupriavidus taiwanensis]|nr:hypothetical protein CBM2588_A180232 [Cupriavidus taiwanensis]SOY50860.1 hypothetical protein CBM2592_A230080 [Cupriavidus taiwanensis]SOY83738.1 hypothetical protein CBM2591_A270090 [Cupriavidus taiwanensis]SOZ23618.1 hypothetical protein CBM2608_A280069 [Cupriavidus taiwanensis]SOZ57977.1 hypothetical protein CBM2617_A260084 [Cupriavidus taiwanensis]